MAEYLITKREKCEACDATGKRVFIDENSLAVNSSSLTLYRPQTTVACRSCVKGYIETSVDLLEVLSKLRFQLDNEKLPNEDTYCQYIRDLRIEE